MFSHEELAQQVSAYCDGGISFEEFENWFEDNSVGAYDMPELCAACKAIDAALSEYYFDHIAEDALRRKMRLEFGKSRSKSGAMNDADESPNVPEPPSK